MPEIAYTSQRPVPRQGEYEIAGAAVHLYAPVALSDAEGEALYETLKEQLVLGLAAVAESIRDKFPTLAHVVVEA